MGNNRYILAGLEFKRYSLTCSVATGWMSQKFVTDLLVSRPDAKATHEIVAIGSSSLSKAEKFVSDIITASSPSQKPELYDNYEGVYDNANVDIVYVGTPHSLHKQNCLDAIERGKNVLCEKPFAINAREAEEVVTKARQKGVYIMEGEFLALYLEEDSSRKDVREVCANQRNE